MAAQADGLATPLRGLHMRPQVPPQLPGHVCHACTGTTRVALRAVQAPQQHACLMILW